jgi:hypothetical protein
MARAPSGTDVASILEASRRNNAEVGVTGALCHFRGSYMQYLEGEEAAIECVMAGIAVDRRHANLVVLEYRFIAMRAFAEWSMALITSNEEIREVLGPLADMGLNGIQPAEAATVFRLLTRTSQWVNL